MHSAPSSARLWPFIAFVASCASTCTYEGSQDLPAGTDLHRFDPVASYPAMLAAAGAGVTLEKIETKYVREDGTQDLTASYIPSHLKTIASYELWGPNTQRDPKLPVGASGTDPFMRTVVEVSEPRWITVNRGGKSSSSYKHLGLYMRRDPVPSKPDPVPPPACAFAKLWTLAKTRGAPAGAIAEIKYDRSGYRFKIDGTQVDLHFDMACKLKP